jgi:hypothetical protein
MQSTQAATHQRDREGLPGHQTARLGRGRHERPGPVVCVMELASMLAGESFRDRPAAVCPVLGALLRTYNDVIDDSRRQDLYRFASDTVGTRGDDSLHRRRAALAIGWARTRYEARRKAWGPLARPSYDPDLAESPDRIAEHVIASIRRHTDSTHAAILRLFDQLIACGLDVVRGQPPLVTAQPALAFA